MCGRNDSYFFLMRFINLNRFSLNYIQKNTDCMSFYVNKKFVAKKENTPKIRKKNPKTHSFILNRTNKAQI